MNTNFKEKGYYLFKQVLNWILMILLGFLILTALLKKSEKVLPRKDLKIIENRIHTRELRIKDYTDSANNEKVIIASLSKQFLSLKQELEKYKNVRDTFNIIQVQDTIINVLDDENNRLKSVVNFQDSIILAQRYIINSKDTIITSQKFDVKRLKKQRNISVLLNVLLGTVAVIK
jgi:hypothetical protein